MSVVRVQHTASRFCKMAAALLLTLGLASVAYAQSITVTPNPIDFGQVRSGDEGFVEGTITANDPLGISVDNVFVFAEGEQEGSPFFVFITDSECGVLPCYLEDGQSLDFIVYFYLDELGTFTDDLVVEWFQGDIAAAKTSVLDQTLVPMRAESIPSISTSPSSLDFTAVIGSTVTMDLEIVNEISYDLAVNSIFVRDASSSFSVDNAGGFSLGPGQSVVINISFEPPRAGFYADDLVFVTEPIGAKASAAIETSVPLTGEGISLPSPLIEVDPLEIDFGTVLLGENTTENLTITNDGSADLVVDTLAVVGTDDAIASFSVPGSGFILGPDESRVIPVSFAPVGAGLIEGTVLIGSNDPDYPVFEVLVSGTGEEPVLEPGIIDFGQVVVGQEASSDVVIENPGQTALNVSVGIFEDERGSFSAAPNAFVIPPGGRQLITFTFAPQATGADTAAVLIESEQAPITYILQGEGVAPNIVVGSRSLNFGTVPLGNVLSRQVTVSNLGNSDLLISDTQIIGGNGQFEITAMGGPRVVMPDGSFVIEVTFTSALDGPQSATLRILSNDPDEPALDIALSGTSSCALMASESSLPFGDVRVGETATREVVVSHSCASSVNIKIEVGGEDAFTVDPQGTFTLAAGASETLTVTFRPTGGDQAAILEIDDEVVNSEGVTVDGPLAGIDISMMGRGLEPDLVLGAEQVSFGTVTLGRMASMPLVITNAGDADLVLSSLSIGGSNPTAFQIEDASASTLAPGGMRTLNLIFSPTTAGARSAVLRIVSDDPDTPQRTIPLLGNGMAVQSETPDIADDNTAAPVTFQVPEDLQNASGQLFYRRGGDQAYTSTPLSASGTTIEGQVPATFVTPRGVQYYVTFDVDGGTVTYPEPDQPLQLRVRVASLSPQETESAFTLTPEIYRMVSMPLALEDPSVNAQFSDDYGALDPNIWRMLRWNPDTQTYQEYSGVESFRNEGLAAWLVTSTGASFDVENGLSRNLEEPFEIVLEPGWNQIGNPFLFDVAWSDVVNNSAVAAPGLYFWNGTTYEMGAPRLQPWEGYFVFNPSETEVTIAVPPVAAGAQAAKQEEELFPAASYLLQLRAEVPEQGLQDVQNFIGFSANAQHGQDANDWLEAPGIGQQVRLSVVQGGQAFASAFKPQGAEGGIWDLEVDVATVQRIRTRPTTVQVTLNEQGARPDGFNLYVIDTDEGRVLPVSEGTFSVTVPTNQSVRHLRVVVGTEAFAESESDGVSLVPVDYALEANYPNPFNPETVIRYSLNAQSKVELTIFNVLGQRIRTLVQADQTSGQYEVRWDGHDEAGQSVASGVYIYRLRADGFTASRKMLLLR